MKKFIKKVFILLIVELILLSVISNSAFYDIDYGPDSHGMADYTEEEAKKESQDQLNTSNNNSQEYVGKSSNNYLKLLQVENEKLDKEFQKEILDYEVILKDKNNKKINIKAIADDENAIIKGDGEVKLNDGINNVQIVVTAENGNVQIYTLKIKFLYEESEGKMEEEKQLIDDNVGNEIQENTNTTVLTIVKIIGVILIITGISLIMWRILILNKKNSK